MQELAQIFVTHTEILPGKYELSYTWEGDASAPVYVVGGDDQVKRLPWRLRLLEMTPYGDKYIRTDVKFWRLTYAKNKIMRVLQWVNNRLIVTAHVWGLVKIIEAEIPSWSRAFANKWSKPK